MKKNILVVTDEMQMGGVSRIINTLLSMIDRNRYDVDLLVLHKRGELLSEVPSWVNVIGGTEFFATIDVPINSEGDFSMFNKLRLLTYMKTGLIKSKIKSERKKILKKHYDIEFSAKEGFCTIFNAYGDSDRKINWVQVDYKISNYSKNHMGLMRDALDLIDMNIACSDTVRDSFAEVFGIRNIVTVHNLIDEKRIRNLSLAPAEYKQSENKINLICVARFHYQKGLDRLLNVYAKVKEYYNLVIVGDGDLKEKLYAQAKELGIFDDITWTGIMYNPYPEVRKADLFVMPSVYEGYPTITVESLISDTPVLTFLVAGVKEQILNEEDGWVIPNDEKALLDKLMELKDQKTLLVEYKKRLENYHYDNESIMKRYYSIFEGEE